MNIVPPYNHLINYPLTKISEKVKNNKDKYNSLIFDEFNKYKTKLRNEIIDPYFKSISLPCDILKHINSLKHISYNNGRSVIKGDYKNNTYVFKFDMISCLIHEYFIGKYVVNNLADILPTFTKTHAFITITGEPIFIDGYPVLQLCKPLNLNEISKKNYDDIQGMIIIDHIKGNSLASVVPTITLESLSLILLNLFMSLKEGYNKYGFVHWDLHTENIILREDIRSFKYEDKIYRCGEYLPVIFDYGYSQGNNNGEEYKTYERLGAGLNPDWKNKFIDIWKLLNTLIYDCYLQERHDLYQFLKSFIIKFFIPRIKSKNFFNFMYFTTDNYCFIKPSDKFIKTHDNLITDFIKHIKIRIPSFKWIIPTHIEQQNTISNLYNFDYLNDVKQLYSRLYKSGSDKEKYLLYPYILSKINDKKLESEITKVFRDLHKKYYKYDIIDIIQSLKNKCIIVPDIKYEEDD
jgi:hypothetical protein